MQRIGLLTSGGDAPGMNAAIRAVVRKGVYHGLEVTGIMRGLAGFIDGDVLPMNVGSVADIIHRGGTILRTARSEDFATREGRATAYENVERFRLQGLVVIGGDGSFEAARVFHDEYGLPVVGIPATIDNDIAGTEACIGFDTAVNNVVEAITKIRDTATSHERTFIVEVMGRNSGFIALQAGLAGGAESIIIPELPYSIDEVCQRLMRGYQRGKLHSMIVVAEGVGSGIEIGRAIKARTGFDTKVTILGHIQRGGTPTAIDCVLGSRFGAKGVELLMDGKKKVAVGLVSGNIIHWDLGNSNIKPREIDMEVYRLAGVLSI
ncbi:MAG: 6-phosphofructokinase [Eubacteriales bacterium]|nr:6-phosphofructokinase [Bacillota bacterium]MBV1727301.1 6-phosphofructokinase [Desulforudis sp.]MDQ7789305.1 6-phosphofructokinase [Clostridia bacterium]MDZ4043115.1 6-phosphofructokinase [Eubacteriales bacterium]MBV1736426.1 6-phosphofructokinase [Desulforudis sp.]